MTDFTPFICPIAEPHDRHSIEIDGHVWLCVGRATEVEDFDSNWGSDD